VTIRRLKFLLLAFFVALALPTSILVFQAYGQLKWEAFHQHQLLARELSLRIDAQFQELIEREENRPITDYAFLNVTGTEQSAFLQRSPLSQFPLASEIPGLLGYFQVDSAGQLQTPTVPRENAGDYGIGADELRQRVDQENNLRAILGQNRLVKRPVETPVAAAPSVLSEEEAPAMEVFSSVEAVEESVQDLASFADEDDSQGLSVFDRLNSPSKITSKEQKAEKSAGRVADLKLDDRYQVAEQLQQEQQSESKKRRKAKSSRIETTVLPEAIVVDQLSNFASEPADSSGILSKQQVARIRTFESEVDSLEFSLLDSGHFVLFRRVWQDGQRYVQGLLFDQKQFVDNLIRNAYEESSLHSVSDLVLAYQGNLIQLFGASYSRDYNVASAAGSELLYQTRLVAPFSNLELIYSLARLPIGAGGQIILWSAFVLGLVLVGGVFMLYRLGAGQIGLARQQQDFVSAVSHELKTPLTSIRMYGEMLREGWADESRKKSYYDFIFNESERLSRLINNVLQLARLSRSEQVANLEPVSVSVLVDDLSSRLESQLQQAGFSADFECDEDAKNLTLNIDSDWFAQIMINLVDNAIKFSANADEKSVDLRCQLQQGRVVFSVRDYGLGIPKGQMKKIFKLFYRSENELTRETVGTGIGLSLVQQLASAMRAEVDVLNRDPGVEFRVSFGVMKQA